MTEEEYGNCPKCKGTVFIRHSITGEKVCKFCGRPAWTVVKTKRISYTKTMKDKIQEMADEIADTRFGAEFYDLTDDQQTEVYQAASEQYVGYYSDMVDNTYERLRDLRAYPPP